MNKRRRMVLKGLGIAAVVGVGAVGIGDVVTRAEIAAAVRRRLPMLRLDEAGLHEFAKDQIAVLLAKRPSLKRVRTRIRMVLDKTPPVKFGMSTDKRTKREHLEDNLATLYLLSSDFFWKGADQSRTIKYIALYDPMRACGNPFARPVPDATATS